MSDETIHPRPGRRRPLIGVVQRQAAEIERLREHSNRIFDDGNKAKLEASDYREALGQLLSWAEGADLQIHGEFGVGAYIEAEEIGIAREVIAKHPKADA